MPIRAHNFVTPSSAYQQAMQLFLTIRARAVAFEAQFSGGGAADQVKSCYADFAGFVTQLNTLRAVPGYRGLCEIGRW